MRIIADLDENGHGHIYALIWCSQFSGPKPTHLIVDTGSTITTLLGDDVTRLSINCANLRLAHSQSVTASGPVTPYLLPYVDLGIEVQYGWFNRNQRLWRFRFQAIHCMPPTHPQFMSHQRIAHAYSLLGMDFLRLFKKWRYTDTKLIMET